MIPPTLTVSEASRREWEAVVIGAGPAGSLAARELARWGVRVLLVDKSAFPRWKVCGCCLNARAVSILERHGLGPLLRVRGAVPLNHFLLAARGRRAVLPLSGSAALSREKLDAALVEAAVQAGAAFLPETRASLGPVSTRARTVSLRGKDGTAKTRAALVLLASGLGSSASGSDRRGTGVWDTRIGAAAVLSSPLSGYGPGVIFMASAQGGYVGLVRVEDDRLEIAAALDSDFVRRNGGLGPAAERVVNESGLAPVPGLSRLLWRGTPQLNVRAARVADHRLFRLGDAAGYIGPFTGEGIAWALAGADAVLPLALRAVRRWETSLVGAWESGYRRAVAHRQMTCRVLTTLVRFPALTGVVAGVLGRWPGLARPVLRRLSALAPTDRGRPE